MAQKLWKSLKLKDGKIVSDYDKSEWIVGEYRKNPYTVTTECRGFNCSTHIGDAMGYVNCEVLAKVKIRGTVITGDTKITAQEMKIVNAWRWTKIDSVEMAIYVAELVINHYENEYPNDTRPRQAIEAATAYLANPTNAKAANAANATYYAANAAANAANAANATYYAANAAYYAANAAANAAYYAANAAYYAANAAASKEDREKAREEMKTKIDIWVISHLKNCEQVH